MTTAGELTGIRAMMTWRLFVGIGSHFSNVYGHARYRRCENHNGTGCSSAGQSATVTSRLLGRSSARHKNEGGVSNSTLVMVPLT